VRQGSGGPPLEVNPTGLCDGLHEAFNPGPAASHVTDRRQMLNGLGNLGNLRNLGNLFGGDGSPAGSASV